MDVLNSRTLKAAAGERLSQAGCAYQKLAFFYGAGALCVPLLASLMHYTLNLQISHTGGLSGMGTRAILQTLQLIVQYAVNIALPFWEMGFLFVALQLFRGQTAEPRSLTEGFRRFGPVLRLNLTQGLLYLGVGIACMYIGAIIFSVTPLSGGMMAFLMPLVESGASMEQVQETVFSMSVEELFPMFLPFLIIAGLLYAVAAVYLFYRFRMAGFLIMDRPGTGALAALILSGRMTRGHRWQLFRLDLSFWWFYGVMALGTLAMYADVLFQYIVADPAVSQDVVWLLGYLAGVAIQLLLLWRSGCYVQVTYAAAYQALLEQPVQVKVQPVLKFLPWDDYPPQNESKSPPNF